MFNDFLRNDIKYCFEKKKKIHILGTIFPLTDTIVLVQLNRCRTMFGWFLAFEKKILDKILNWNVWLFPTRFFFAQTSQFKLCMKIGKKIWINKWRICCCFVCLLKISVPKRSKIITNWWMGEDNNDSKTVVEIVH